MKKVITEPINRSIVVLSDTKEFRMYFLVTTFSIYMLHMLPDTLEYPYPKWQWLSILRPKQSVGIAVPKFYNAMQLGIEKGKVYEIEDISDLAEFLKDREEEYLDEI